MLVLASESPRRRQALEALGIAIRVVPSGIEEARLPGEPPAEFALREARAKVETVVRRLAADGERPWVLGADTVVAIGDQVLGKPVDRQDARRMIGMLAGRTHRVATAWVLGRDGEEGREGVAVTEVRFRPMTAEEIDRYVATGEGDDKAGAYGIQGHGLWNVDRVHGSLTCVVCLPVPEVLEALRAVGCVP